MIMRHDHPMHRRAINGGRSEPRQPKAEVLRCVFSGAAVGGREHVVTVLAGDMGERCQMVVDGVPTKAASWSRCRAAVVKRVFREIQRVHTA